MCYTPGVNTLLIVSLEGVVDFHQLEFGRGFDYTQPLSINMLNVGNALMKQIVSIEIRVVYFKSAKQSVVFASTDLCLHLFSFNICMRWRSTKAILILFLLSECQMIEPLHSVMENMLN